jgi:hypothetical protein
MQEWIEKLIGKEVAVVTRHDETEHTGTLLAVDLEPQSHGMGPSAVLENDDRTLTIAFDVEYIDELHEDDV